MKGTDILVLMQVVKNLMKERFSYVKGTIYRGATSLNYVHMVLLPVLSTLFDHLGCNHFGNDLIGVYALFYIVVSHFSECVCLGV